MKDKICQECGNPFDGSPRPGRHHPKDCPEGLDLFCPACDQEVYETECKNCRKTEL